MGLLEKTNPRATIWSVLKRSFIMAAIGATIYLLAAFTWNKKLQENLGLGLFFWTLLFASVGGVFEWQVGDLDDSIERPTDPPA